MMILANPSPQAASSRLSYQRSTTSLLSKLWKKVFKKYIRYLPLLLLSVGCWWGVWQLVTTFTPDQVRDVWFANSFLPLLTLWWLGCWAGASYLLLNTRRGVVVATVVTTWWWLRLNQLNQIEVTLVLMTLGTGFELVATLLEKASKRDNLS